MLRPTASRFSEHFGSILQVRTKEFGSRRTFASVRSLSRHPGRVRVIAAFMVALYLFASLGIMPAPAVVIRWFGSAIDLVEGFERYPCEDHACGCVSAIECWSHCCCHTPQQRLVWAITHGVQPPASVKFSDDQWIAASNAVSAGSAACAVCVEETRDRLARGIAITPDSVVSEHCSACPGESQARKPPSTTGVTISALACKGVQQILAVSAPPAAPVSVRDAILTPAATPSTAMPQDVGPESRSLEVPEPPPRQA